MRLSVKRGLLACTVAFAAAAAPFTVAASANTKSTFEPVFIAGGFVATCNPDAGIAQAVVDTLAHPSPSWGVPRPVPATDVKVWTANEPAGQQYLMCNDLSVPYLAQNFSRALRAFRTAEIAKYDALRQTDPTAPHIDKIDVVGLSLGTTVSRYCIKYNSIPVAGQPSCADMIDDWVGIAPPSHGSTSFTNTNCSYTAMYEKICRALIPSSSVQYELNTAGGDETPFGDTDTGGHVEYSTMWSQTDGIIAPPTSAKLTGAVNHEVFSSAGPITHADILSTSKCPGGAFVGPATGEWAAYELLDVVPHASAASTAINCAVGPPAP